MFRHKNHHPKCPNDEDIYKIAFHGGHFEIQDGRHSTHSKKWNQGQFCSLGHKD